MALTRREISIITSSDLRPARPAPSRVTPVVPANDIPAGMLHVPLDDSAPSSRRNISGTSAAPAEPTCRIVPHHEAQGHVGTRHASRRTLNTLSTEVCRTLRPLCTTFPERSELTIVGKRDSECRSAEARANGNVHSPPFVWSSQALFEHPSCRQANLERTKCLSSCHPFCAAGLRSTPSAVRRR